MKQWTLAGSTALIALVAGNAALADVTPEEVWQSWKDMAVGYGQTVTTASETRDGDTLVVSGLSITSEQDEADATLTIDTLSFRDMGDGRVEMTMSEGSTLDVTVDPVDTGSEPVDMTLALTAPGLVTTVSGSAAEMRYDLVADSIALDLAEISGGDTAGAELAGGVELIGLEGNYIVSGGDAKAISSSFVAAEVAFSFSGNDADSGEQVALEASFDNVESTSTANTVAGMDMADMAAAIQAGFATTAQFAFGTSAFAMEVVGGDSPATITTGAASGGFNLSMGAEGLLYGTTAQGVEMTISSPDIPFPELKVSYADSTFNFAFPLVAGDSTQDFAFLTRIADLVIQEEVWGMFDPTGQLPRDPISLTVDTKGKAKLLVDILDTEAMENLGEGAPGELQALDITEVLLRVAGAELTGQGALTFNNADLESFGGMPAPEGTVEFKLMGGNGLLDKVAAMGLIPEEDLMGARMMMGMFARMVEGEPDTMTSTLEFKDGHFFANGMQLQ